MKGCNVGFVVKKLLFSHSFQRASFNVTHLPTFTVLHSLKMISSLVALFICHLYICLLIVFTPFCRFLVSHHHHPHKSRRTPILNFLTNFCRFWLHLSSGFLFNSFTTTCVYLCLILRCCSIFFPPMWLLLWLV